MNENLVEQVSSSSGIPQMLVSRSAQARAEASGVSVDDVLNSWTGGEAIQSSSAPSAASSTPEAEIAPVVKEESQISEEEMLKKNWNKLNMKLRKLKLQFLLKKTFPHQ